VPVEVPALEAAPLTVPCPPALLVIPELVDGALAPFELVPPLAVELTETVEVAVCVELVAGP
jgi:hypothetical protein